MRGEVGTTPSDIINCDRHPGVQPPSPNNAHIIGRQHTDATMAQNHHHSNSRCPLKRLSDPGQAGRQAAQTRRGTQGVCRMHEARTGQVTEAAVRARRQTGSSQGSLCLGGFGEVGWGGQAAAPSSRALMPRSSGR